MANNILIEDGLEQLLNVKTVYDASGNVHTNVHTDPRANTATVARIAAAQTPTALLATSATRLGFELFNDSNGTAWILRGTGTVSNSNYSFQMSAGSYYSENPTNFTGALSAIWLNANGAIQTTIFTA